MKRILMAAAAITLMMMMTVLTACTSDNDDNTAKEPADASAFVGTWYTDLTGQTHPLWNYGKAWNVWTFQTDGTGVCDVFYTLKDEPIAIEHQPFTYTVGEGVVKVVMADGPWDCTYEFSGDKLTLDETEVFDKANAEQIARFEEWGKRDLIPVSGTPARYTVFIYGNAGGPMDNLVESCVWEKIKPLLTDSTNVRVVSFYKYGKDSKSKYGQDGDIVWFELNAQTDLTKIKEHGIKATSLGQYAEDWKLCDPQNLNMFLQFSSLICPAYNYILTFYGHGGGFDPTADVPEKYSDASRTSRGVLYDEWVNDEALDMYELNQALEAAGGSKLKALFLHNCLLGNMETLTQVRNSADYLFASAHLLASNQTLFYEYIRSLVETDDFEAAGKLAFERIGSQMTKWYQDASEDGPMANGDFKMIRTSDIDGILNATKRLASRLVALYPTQKEAIDRATVSVYRFDLERPEPELSFIKPFFDLGDYARKVAEETGDSELKTISKDLDDAFSKAFVCYIDVNLNQQHLDHYTLSVCLYHNLFYTLGVDVLSQIGLNALNNIQEGYEQCDFHKLTGWGNWLNANEKLPWGNPVNRGGEPLNQ